MKAISKILTKQQIQSESANQLKLGYKLQTMFDHHSCLTRFSMIAQTCHIWMKGLSKVKVQRCSICLKMISKRKTRKILRRLRKRVTGKMLQSRYPGLNIQLFLTQQSLATSYYGKLRIRKIEHLWKKN